MAKVEREKGQLRLQNRNDLRYAMRTRQPLKCCRLFFVTADGQRINHREVRGGAVRTTLEVRPRGFFRAVPPEHAEERTGNPLDSCEPQ